MGLDFYHHICNTCFKTPTYDPDEITSKFPSCSSCKLVSYCCRSHQKADWREHKPFCREVKKVMQARQCSSLFSCLEEPTHESLYKYQTIITVTLEKCLERALTFNERSMVYFPDICGKCLRSNGSAFIPCNECNLEFYCCYDHRDEHSEVHDQDCKSLKVSFELFKFLSSTDNQPPSKCIHRVLTPPLEFPDTLEEYFSRYMEMETASLSDKVIYSDILSYVLSMVYVLRQNVDFSRNTSLKIHILGANHLESYILNILECFFVWFEDLERLDLIFVGPECPPPDLTYINSIVEKHSDKDLNIVFKPGTLYHDFVAEYQEVYCPQVLVAFNCGFHEFKGLTCDTWGKTIDCILNLKNVILITTSYTFREAREDALPFVGVENVNEIKVCERNPFKSMNPHRNPERSESAVYFFNQFISMFHINNTD